MRCAGPGKPAPNKLVSKVFFSPGQRVALFGGSFDPPHDGHRRLALAALKALQVDFVWWLVAPQNPLKAHQPGAMATRLAATGACAAHPRFLVSDEETRLGTRYACDTIRALKARHPGVDFIWLIGADNLAQLHRWKDWQGLMHEVPLAVYPRPTKTLKALAAPAAQRFAHARLATQDAARLARRKTPAWVILSGRQSPLASSAMRGAKK